MARRTLNWTTLDDAVADARMLHETGYERAGNWDLSQVVGHLTIFIQASINGFSISVPGVVPWLMRVTGQKTKFFRTRKVPSGLPIPKRLRVTASAAGPQEEERALQQFVAAVEKFKHHTGSHAPSPVLGPLDHDEWSNFHVIHAMHHLSFLSPVESPEPIAAKT